MKSISESELREFAKSMLFENQITEKYRPDNFTNSKTTMFNRPGPPGGEQIQINVPITSDEMMTNTAFSLKNKNVFDDDYEPQNPQELGHASLSAINIKKDGLQSDDISSIWLVLKKALNKVQ